MSKAIQLAASYMSENQYTLKMLCEYLEIEPLEILDSYFPEEKKARSLRITLERSFKMLSVETQDIFPRSTPKVNCRREEELTMRQGSIASYTEDLGNGIKLEMIAIPGGTFMMGSPDGEGRNNEKPQHEVTVSSFFLGKYPITQAQYQQIMSENPSNFRGDDRPVETVSWDEAVEFCARLSKCAGIEYRLPTEAEWEYACRAGTTTPYYFGETITEQLANYGGNIGKTTSVGQFPPNAFGLYDMHGNVWEWCQDDWHKNYEGTDGRAWDLGFGNTKAIRGSSWVNLPSICRSASRHVDTRTFRDSIIGFRVVSSVP